MPDIAISAGNGSSEQVEISLWGRRFLTGVLMGTLIWDLAEYGLFASYLIFK